MTVTDAAIADNRRPLFAFRCLSRLYFHLPVLLPFALLLTRDKMVEAGVAVATYSVAVAVTSLLRAPEAVAARMSRLALVVLAESGKLVGLLVISLVPTYPVLLAGQVIIGLFFALGAGADGRLPFVYLTGNRRTASVSALQGVMFGAVIMSAVASGFLFAASPSLPFFCAALATLAGILALARIRSLQTESIAGAMPPPPTHARSTIHAMRWWFAYYLVTRVSSMSVYVMLVPAACLLFGLVPQAFGIVLCGFGVGGLVATRLGVKVAARLTFRVAAVLSVVLTAVAVLLGVVGTLSPALLFANVVVLGLAGGMVRPCVVGGLAAAGFANTEQGRIAARLEQFGGLLTAPVVLILATALGAGVAPNILFLAVGGAVAALAIVLAISGRKAKA